MPSAPLSVLIVDDEPLAREGLRMLLVDDPDIAAIHVAHTGRQAVSAIRQHAPDLVLLDVQMPELDGFGVIDELGASRMPAVVFVTAHDQYAIAAFEISAVDYLLKPVTAARFAQAMTRAKARLRAASSEEAALQQVRSLLDVMATRPDRDVREPDGAGDPREPREPMVGRGPARVAVRSGDRTIFIAIDEIEWFGGAENYVELHLVGGSGSGGGGGGGGGGGASGRSSTSTEVHLLQVTMNALERTLDPARFLRIHRSTIVQLARVTELRPLAHGEYQLTLASGAKVRSGRTYHERVKQLLKNPF